MTEEYSMTADSDERKGLPIAEGVLYYFAPAFVEMARLSKVGNDKHNAGQPLHWSREKSNDHADCIVRHLLDAGTDDTDGIPHSVKVAWRACALATEDLIARKGYKPPKNARTAEPPAPPVPDIVQRLQQADPDVTQQLRIRITTSARTNRVFVLGRPPGGEWEMRGWDDSGVSHRYTIPLRYTAYEVEKYLSEGDWAEVNA